jgi:hypothetical protein
LGSHLKDIEDLENEDKSIVAGFKKTKKKKKIKEE